MSNAVHNESRLRVLALGIPLLILVFAGMAITAFLAVNLIIGGLRQAEYSSVVVGMLIAAMWLLMLYKTAVARQRAAAEPARK